MTTTPGQQPTRWERVEGRGYARKFAQLVQDGADLDGEARLVDALAPRGADVLDAGSGMGRVGDGLQRRGHRVVAVDLDADLLEQSRRTYPDLPVVQQRLDLLTPDELAENGHPATYDVVVCVGNVMILLAPATERLVLERLRALLRPGGRLVVGFHTDATPEHSRVYEPDEFVADAEAAGLQVLLRLGGYDLAPYDPEGNYAIHVLARD